MKLLKPLIGDVNSMPLGPTLSVYGTANAPGAGATVAQVSSLAAGSYRIAVLTKYAAGTGETKADNMELSLPAGSSGGPFQLIVSPQGTGTGQAEGVPILALFERVTIGAGTVAVVAVSAATASTIYVAQIVYTPVV